MGDRTGFIILAWSHLKRLHNVDAGDCKGIFLSDPKCHGNEYIFQGRVHTDYFNEQVDL